MSLLLSFLPQSLRRRLILSKMKVDARALAHVRVKVAETEAESIAAARLVHDSYVTRGILRPHDTGIHLSEFSASPTTWTFVAKLGDEVIGTISLLTGETLCGQPTRLPMETIYGPELRPFRAAGELLAEVGALAIAPEYRGSGLVLWLNRIMMKATVALGVDRLVIAVHPNAGELYREALLFSEVGPERAYPGLNKSARAIALSLEMRDVTGKFQRAFASYGPNACNMHTIYAAALPQIQEPDALKSLHRLSARRALRRARPDVVPPRASLSTYPEAFVPGAAEWAVL